MNVSQYAHRLLYFTSPIGPIIIRPNKVNVNTAKTNPKAVTNPSKATSTKADPLSKIMKTAIIICSIVKIVTPLGVSDIVLTPFY